MAIDFEAQGLLEGLDGKAREARLDLLQTLAADGVELDELKRATAEQRLALLPVERVLAGGGARYSGEEIARRTGLERELLDRLWRALGMALADPQEPAYNEGDLEAAERVKAYRDAGMDEEAILEISRVMARGMFPVAATIRNVFANTYLRAGDDEQTLALRFAVASRALTPLLGPTLEHILNVQQRGFIRQAAVDGSMLATGRLPDATEVAIGFADLVGFTKLGEQVDPTALGDVAERLEELARDVLPPPVRLIKTIGDAAMLQAADTAALVAATLDLVERAEGLGEDFPQLRAGTARGEALERGGDWYGRPVNLASRITAIARPGSVLVDQTAKDAAGDGYGWSFAGKRRIKGVDGEVALHRVRHPGGGEGTTPE